MWKMKVSLPPPSARFRSSRSFSTQTSSACMMWSTLRRSSPWCSSTWTRTSRSIWTTAMVGLNLPFSSHSCFSSSVASATATTTAFSTATSSPRICSSIARASSSWLTLGWRARLASPCVPTHTKWSLCGIDLRTCFWVRANTPPQWTCGPLAASSLRWPTAARSSPAPRRPTSWSASSTRSGHLQKQSCPLSTGPPGRTDSPPCRDGGRCGSSRQAWSRRALSCWSCCCNTTQRGGWTQSAP
mmetsp:Transcript_10814/g.34427  ORF Transcript_10814/g.34427 Transcript_10814/m.34427 type:complete len:243 (-) Transcript_10814:196-924(-)